MKDKTENSISNGLGKKVKVVIDRPMGSAHPTYSNLIYPINYGYVPGILAGDGEEQDCYVLGVDHPLETFQGTVIAVIKRWDDIEDKWVVAKEGCLFSQEEIRKQVDFQEKYFESEIILFFGSPDHSTC